MAGASTRKQKIASKTSVVMIMIMIMIMMGGGSSDSVAMADVAKYSALFVLGDSLVDVGNNNFISTVARSDMKPFGIDFAQGPTGRFCNGKVVVDFIADKFGLPYSLPYLDPSTKGAVLLNGVSYASAAGGILRRTGYNFIGRVDMDTQLLWLANTIDELKQMLGTEKAADFVRRSLFVVIMGSNDYVNNYLLSNSAAGMMYSIPEYQALLVETFLGQLQRMYELGARSVSVASVGPIGCIPSQLAKGDSKHGECIKFVNDLAQGFNAALAARMPAFNAKLPGARFILGDVFTPIFDYRTHPEKYGFKYGAPACCGRGKYNGQLICLPFLTPCSNRSEYVFWDAFHPTEKANSLVAESLYKAFL